MTDSRERDAAGRALNARPRDELGRPLPRGSIGVPRIPDDATYTPEQALITAQDLLNRGRAFHAHEVFESVWKSSAAADRWMWRALAQLAVGITHAQRENRSGAIALLRRAADTIDRPALHDVDGVALAAHARALADYLEAGGEPAAAALSPRLTRGQSEDKPFTN